MSRIIILGGTGFIGSHLHKHFFSLGHEVITLGRKTQLDSGFHVEPIDLLNFSSWKKIIKKNDFICFLIPFNLNPANNLTFSEADYYCVLEELLKTSAEVEVSKFLYLSSGGSIYGNYKNRYSETDIPKPISDYGKHKLKSENVIINYKEKFGLPVSIARPSNIYGDLKSNSSLREVLSTFYNRVNENLPLKIFGNLDICKDYLHINDLVPALGNMCLNHQGIFNLGLGKSIKLSEVIETIEKKLKKQAILEFHPPLPHDVLHYELDCNKAKVELEFKPIIELEEGIARFQGKNT